MLALVAKRTAAIAIAVACAAIVVCLTAFKGAIEQARKQLAPAFARSLLGSYTPATGDVVMVHYLGHGMIGIPVAEHWPTHAGMVWVSPRHGPVVLECTKFSAPALPNMLQETLGKERGVRAVPWGEYVNAADNVLYIRQVTHGAVDPREVQRHVDEWAVHLDFETRIADSMTLDLTVAIGFVTVWPRLAAWCARAARLHDARARAGRAFCSEFVVQLLQRLGAVDARHTDAFRVGPASLLQSAGALDRMAAGSPLGLRWGEDRMLVRRA